VKRNARAKSGRCPEKRTGLARALSKLGFCSRSRAWALIGAGRVRVNGALQRNPERPVTLDRDRIEVDGRMVRGAEKLYLMLNKPRGLVTTASDEKARDTVFKCLTGPGAGRPRSGRSMQHSLDPQGPLPPVFPVGRLDKASEGLLLFTNDTGWAAGVSDPESHLEKIYHVQVDCLADETLACRLHLGVRAAEGFLAAKRVRLLRQGDKNSWLEVVLAEGKNRQIRRLLAALGIQVLRIVRVGIGPLALGPLAKGQWRHLTGEEVSLLARSAGSKMVPMPDRRPKDSLPGGFRTGAVPRLRLRITADAGRQIRSGHPWLFADSIRDQNRPGSLGELAVIYDQGDRFLAVGLFDPNSPLRVRVLHTGQPQTIDRDWWRARLAQSLERRRGLFDEQTTGYRLIHGESDGWPGVVLDRYDLTFVLKLYTAAWLPRLEELIDLIGNMLSPATLILRLSRNIVSIAGEQFGRPDGHILFGDEVAACPAFLESGLRFEADVLHGQKTGFFLDQRENRRQVERFARGRAMLNVFSFSGGFSLYAARGGAVSAIDLDNSAQALAGAKRHFFLNRMNPTLAKCRHEILPADAFDWLAGSAAGEFDLIVLDPPSLAKRESDRAKAIQADGKLAKSAIQRLRRGGILVSASCSAHVSANEFFAAIRSAARQTGRKFSELLTTGHPPDHPAAFKEAEYLKCIYLQFF
jgi:23S rRNA (cytosine1962-C5)-methyltransferase